MTNRGNGRMSSSRKVRIPSSFQTLGETEATDPQGGVSNDVDLVSRLIGSAHSNFVSFTRSTANRKNATASACRFISSPYAHLSASSIKFFHRGYFALAH